jgi:hypothetical protein
MQDGGAQGPGKAGLVSVLRLLLGELDEEAYPLFWVAFDHVQLHMLCSRRCTSNVPLQVYGCLCYKFIFVVAACCRCPALPVAH